MSGSRFVKSNVYLVDIIKSIKYFVFVYSLPYFLSLPPTILAYLPAQCHTIPSAC